MIRYEISSRQRLAYELYKKLGKYKLVASELGVCASTAQQLANKFERRLKHMHTLEIKKLNGYYYDDMYDMDHVFTREYNP
jgi:hypothetical protein